jgi:cobalt-zinc-cadmium efflux system membrane fusion protein
MGQVMILRWSVLLGVLVCGGCAKKPAASAKPAAPATVAHQAKESDLNTIVLTPEAEERLGIQTAAVERRAIRRRRMYGGEVVLPTGASITVSAPIGGTLLAVSAGNVPDVGAHVDRNQPVFLLAPMLSKERDVLTPAERIALAQIELQISQAHVDAVGQLEQAQTRVDATQIDFDRAQRLFEGGVGVGTRAAFDTAKANFDLARKVLTAAEQRCEVLEKAQKIGLESETGAAAPIPILSPRDGVVRLQHVTIGEIVPAGAPLFEVMDYDPIWVKVPIYGGEIPSIAENEPARVSGLGETDAAKALVAEPVQAPPTADPQAATVDLYYSLANADRRLRPGQRLTVGLALRDKEESLVVAYSAVEYDPSSGAWVYVVTAPHTFVRRRVQIAFVADDLAVIDNGPAEGEQVVTVGAAELWGTEFGAGH